MNPEIATSIRAVLLSIGAAAVTKGWIDSGTLEIVVGSVVAALTFAWSIYAKQGGSKEAQQVAVKVDAKIEKDAAKVEADNQHERKPSGGFVRIAALLFVLLFASMTVVGFATLAGCGSMPHADTKNKAQALTYYSIGQGYAAVNAAYGRREISEETARTRIQQIDLARLTLDITRDPTNSDIQDLLQETVDLLSAATVDGTPALSLAQQQQAQAILSLARAALAGGPLPQSGDTAGWLLLGSDVLRAVTSSLPAKK